ncbi:hypothetical protein QE399_001846 [Paracidovorax wautersii]|uniref:Lipoprotein n=2 Tax=Paracidovorax wautersii TaxID=1177982 RepID=A0ABU1IBJ9_9BURK|nr:hypothetical protein [Paracidovorax wautersii]
MNFTRTTTRTTDISRRTAAAAMLALLAACGGGGGGSDAPPAPGGGDGGGGGGTDPGTPAPPTTPTPPTTPSVVTGQYRLLPAATDFAGALAAMNAQGAEGFAFLSAMGPSGAPGAFGDFYVSDTAHTGVRLEYATQPNAASADAALAQMNAQGTHGFQYKSGVSYGSVSDLRSLYVKDASRSNTYSYERQPATGAVDRAAFDAQLNAQGARGYRFVGPLAVGNEFFSLYVKDASATTYSYTLRDAGAANGAALQQQLSELGAQGFMYQGALVVQGSTVVMFEKSSAQNGPLEYQVEESNQSSLDQMLARLNERAAQGFFFFSDVVAGDGKIYTISVKNAVALRHPLAGITFP